MAGGALVFLAVVLLILLGLLLTAYTRRGSGISEEADDGRDGAPAAKTHPGETHITGESSSLDTHGTK